MDYSSIDDDSSFIMQQDPVTKIYTVENYVGKELKLIVAMLNEYTLSVVAKYIPSDYKITNRFFIEIITINGSVFRFKVDLNLWHEFKVNCVDGPLVSSERIEYVRCNSDLVFSMIADQVYGGGL